MRKRSRGMDDTPSDGSADDGHDHLHEHRGNLRALTPGESRAANRTRSTCCCCGFCGCRTQYRYVVTEPYTLTWNGRTVTVPARFLTDGSSGGPDYGTSWLYHDYLYATHAFTSGEACTRAEADQVMADVLEADRMYIYCRTFLTLSRLNPFWLFSSAWGSSGARGPEFLPEPDEPQSDYADMTAEAAGGELPDDARE